jgi:hypothetical protein
MRQLNGVYTQAFNRSHNRRELGSGLEKQQLQELGSGLEKQQIKSKYPLRFAYLLFC